MFKRVAFCLVALIAFSAAGLAEDKAAKAQSDLSATGMSQASIDSVKNLDNKFNLGFATVAGNQEATDKFIGLFRKEADAVLNAMPAADKAIYEDFKKKNGMSS